MNYTQNYQLPQWVETDRILMDDFNDMTEKLEEALTDYGNAMEGFGNCQIVTGSYVGTGAVNKTLTFPGSPLVVIIRAVNDSPDFCLMMRNCENFHTESDLSTSERGAIHAKCRATWTENSVSWYLVYNNTQDAMMNGAGRTYVYAALLSATEE